ncbi:hypothetical protein BGZ65_000148, partial [Modicella reniformis]
MSAISDPLQNPFLTSGPSPLPLPLPLPDAYAGRYLRPSIQITENEKLNELQQELAVIKEQ